GEATGRQVVYGGNLGQSVREKPDAWKTYMAMVDDTVRAGIRANPMVTPNTKSKRFTMRNSQEFRGVPSWHPIMLVPDEAKLRAYRDHEVRRKLHEEVVEWKVDMPGAKLPRNWTDKIWVEEVVLPKNKSLEGKSLRELAQAQCKGIIDAFLDLVVDENLDTVF